MQNQPTVYDSEIELSYRLLTKIFLSKYYIPKLKSGEFKYQTTHRIAQAWLSQTPNSRSRIRAEQCLSPKTPETYTHTVKYFDPHNPTQRIEINAPITHEEFTKILMLTPDSKLATKTRETFLDTKSGYTYYMDTYPKSDPNHAYINLEIEFANEGDVKDYTPPEWLTEALQATKEKEGKHA